MSQFSRRTIFAAIDVLDSKLSQAETSRFILKVKLENQRKWNAPNQIAIRGEDFSVRKRMNDLFRFVVDHPNHSTDDGPLEIVIVEEAVTLMQTHWEWPVNPESPEPVQTFKRALRQDGFDVADGSLRPALPKDIGIPHIESELIRLLEGHGFSTAKGHLDQAFDDHTRGNWAAANGQLRTFIEALFDKIADKLDQSARALKSGQSKRVKLAELEFFDSSLNEWDNHGKGFINGLIKRLHPEGPHPGLSSEDDSTFRMHIVLLTAMLFLRRYDQKLECQSESESDPSPW